MQDFSKSIAIPPQGDEYDDIRREYAEMLKNQLEKGNNGLAKRKYITFGIEADDLRTAKMRLERVETDVLNNFKTLGVQAVPLSGLERLELLHSQLHPSGQEKFKFAWSDLAKTGLSTKDFIAPTSFTFSKDGKTFRIGEYSGAMSFLQILAPELTDRMLAEFLDLDDAVTVNLHIQSIDQATAIRNIKRKMSDLQKMKIEEQKKAVRAGYDMDIIPTDLATYGEEAQNLLQDLQSRNERMFLVTVLVQNIAPKRQKLFSDIMAASGIAQKYNCALKRLDYQQEQGLMSSLALGQNQIEIQRGLTTSSTAIFVPFTTCELFQDGQALYYGLNAISSNLIMANRKLLKNPNGLFLGTPGCFSGDTRILLADGSAASFEELLARGVEEIEVKTFDDETGRVITAMARDIRVEKYADVLKQITLEDGTTFRCTESHLIMDDAGEYMQAVDVKEGQKLSGGHTAARVSVLKLPEKVPVYDLKVDTVALRQADFDRQIFELQEEKRKLYEALVSGGILLPEYKEQKEQISERLLEVQNTKAVVMARLEAEQEERQHQRQKMDISRMLTESDGLTSELVDLLIDKIYVYPDKRVDIAFKIRDSFTTHD